MGTKLTFLLGGFNLTDVAIMAAVKKCLFKPETRVQNSDVFSDVIVF
jgi:hypothetical protein